MAAPESSGITDWHDVILVSVIGIFLGGVITHFFKRWNSPTVSPAYLEKHCTLSAKGCALLRETERNHILDTFKKELIDDVEKKRKELLDDIEKRKVEEEQRFNDFKKETRRNFGQVKGMLIMAYATKIDGTSINVEELKKLMGVDTED